MRRRRVSVSPSYMWAIVDSYGRIRAVTKTRFYARHFKRSDEYVKRVFVTGLLAGAL